MKAHATEAEIQAISRRVEELGFRPHLIHGVERTVIALVGDERGHEELQQLESMGGVEHMMPVLRPFKLASREVKPEGSRIKVGTSVVGGPMVTVIAGPCAIEGEEQINSAAEAVKK